ncbi:MAG: sugar-transfer associated ATP-grasp domain-containing protein [Firmicutes bacterium]|nr:sugar-transfer associated ATP-grasp domain-containing protein [Bacillota bacterium]
MSMEDKAKKFVKSVWFKIKWRKQVELAVKEAKSCALATSYFPEKEHKTEKQRVEENIAWAKKFGEPNKFYTLYGLDCVKSKPEEFMDYWHFMTSRNIANHMGQLDSQLVILRDKFMFYKYMKSCNLPVPEVFAIWKKGKLYDVNFNEIEWKQLENRKDYFVKSIDGECASFVKRVSDFDDLTQIKTKFEKDGAYIFQEKVIQSEEMNVLNPNALNTYRIVTINKDGRTYLLTALLRVGTKKTGNVDNWAVGGLAIGISDSGYLKEYGFYKPIYGTKINVHPDTGIKFSEFRAPEYKQAVELACRAHKTLYGIRAIGWDVAISDHGPVFIEGNDNWEISLNQACDRPLRTEWEDVIS